jgi:hypothetical protein
MKQVSDGNGLFYHVTLENVAAVCSGYVETNVYVAWRYDGTTQVRKQVFRKWRCRSKGGWELAFLMIFKSVHLSSYTQVLPPCNQRLYLHHTLNHFPTVG